MPCTTILVGKRASNDHSTMIARTDDGHFDDTQQDTDHGLFMNHASP